MAVGFIVVMTVFAILFSVLLVKALHRWSFLEERSEHLRELQAECVRRGFAEQIANEYGEVQFTFIPTENSDLES